MAAAAHQISHARTTGYTHAPRGADLEARPGGLPRTRNPNPHTRARVHPHTRPRPHPGNVRGCTPKKPTYTYDQFGRMTRKTGGDTTKYGYGAGWDVLNEEDGSGNLQATYIHSSCGGSATPGKQIGTVLATSEGTSAATGTWNYPPTADLRHIPSKIPRRRTILPTDTTARMRTAGSPGGRWAWSTARMFMRMW